MNKLTRKNKKGFTIVEVVIVLAIAALIITIVLLAVSALQRAQRDRARGDAAARLVSQMQNNAADNGGTFVGGADFEDDYVDAANLPDEVTNVDEGTGPADENTWFYGTGTCDNGSGAIIINTTGNFAVSYWSESKRAAVCRTTEDQT